MNPGKRSRMESARIIAGGGLSLFHSLLTKFSGAANLKFFGKKQVSRRMAPMPGLSDFALGIFELENPNSIEERLQLALKIGKNRLGLTSGIIARHKNGACKVLEIISDDDPRSSAVCKGEVVASRRLFCGEMSDDHSLLVIDVASQSQWARHAAFQQLAWKVYIGCRVPLAEGEYLTLGFFQPKERDQVFAESDKEFVGQLTRWIAAVLLRNECGGDREKRSELDIPAETNRSHA